MLFNVNHFVNVKLTPLGRQLLREHHARIYADTPTQEPEYKEPATDENGWTRMQMHDLMNKLGPYVFNGFNNPFETTIEIIEGQ